MQNITINDIMPFARYIGEFDYPGVRNGMTVMTYDHRLFYITKGSGIIEISGVAYKMQPGTVVYLMSGTPYTIKSDNNSILCLVSLNFDFIKSNKSTIPYLRLTSPSVFEPSQRIETINFTDIPALNSPIVIHNMMNVYSYLKSTIDEYQTNDNFSETQISHLLSVVFNLICRNVSEQVSPRHSRSYKKILDYIHNHYSEEIDNKTLARKFNYHPNYVSQLIAKHTGISLHQYLLKVRIRHALQLLEATDMPINEIGAQVGFKDPSYFSQYFKKCTGHSPKKFRI